MRKNLVLGIIASLIGVTACNSGSNITNINEIQSNQISSFSSRNTLLRQQSNFRLEAEAGEILVALKTGRMRASIDRINSKYGTKIDDSIPSLDTVLLKIDNKAKTNDIIKSLLKDPDVEVAGPNYKVWTMLDVNDPMVNDQYALKLVEAKKAWDITQGRAETVIAIVDTGIDLTHPDLKDKLVPGFSALKDKENDHNQKEGGDDNGHGTHCAGIAAGIGNNGLGIAGIALKNKIMPVRVLGGAGSGSLFSIAKGIDWATDNGASVISMSLGGPSSAMDLIIERAVNKALKKNIPVVAAMGNSGKEEKSVPACIKGVIAVGATDSNDRKAPFSTFGSHISVTAPGVQILSTMPTYDVFITKEYGVSKNYAALSGTSMATPVVSGIVGLIRAKYPSLTPAQIKERLEKSSDDLGQSGFDKLYGHGRVNAYKALL
ncbi:MAG: thermitase [Candidatus Sericytochromatia bacterium]|nr:MAG: thermitase [Candidatus Sericytochromatia bacterium]